MNRQQKNRVAPIFAVLLVFAAIPVSADTISQIIVGKIYNLVLIVMFSSLIFQIVFVRYCARFLGLQKNFLSTIGAVLVGGVIGSAFGFASIFVAWIFPPLLQSLVFSAAGMAGGALGIKIVFTCPFPKALLIYLLALVANSLAVGLVLILAY